MPFLSLCRLIPNLLRLAAVLTSVLEEAVGARRAPMAGFGSENLVKDSNEARLQLMQNISVFLDDS